MTNSLCTYWIFVKENECTQERMSKHASFSAWLWERPTGHLNFVSHTFFYDNNFSIIFFSPFFYMPCLLLPTSHCMLPLQPREYTISILTCVHCRCLWQELQPVPERPLCMGSLKWLLLLPSLSPMAQLCERRVTLSKLSKRSM